MKGRIGTSHDVPKYLRAITERRVALKMSLAALGRRAGYSTQALHHAEKGATQVRLSTFLRLCEAVGLAPEDAIRGASRVTESRPVFDEPYRTVPVSGGKFIAIVDTEDHAKVAAHTWSILGNSRHARYAAARIVPGDRVLMHRFLIGAPMDKEVHHVNNDPLDNRKQNLEVVDRAEHRTRHRTCVPVSAAGHNLHPLRLYLIENGIRCGDFAKKARVSPTHLSKVLNFRCRPHLDTAHKLATATRGALEWRDFVAATSDPKPEPVEAQP